uniref:Leucine zipper transcription factor-like protein 1 n=1 Tax=Chlamydomonas euryale TaxID=1486919 RepID=A0A7R9Z355_9CHLO|mmetsp:Transcript_41653/g.124514  ORF Transcript_41653/g.124514 Transcript_41653/m.124514 type:complete len:328 (+) Transcript_41653:268-1251(+)
MADLRLSDDGEMQVQAYLRFAKLKRDQHVRETVSVISEFQAEHIRRGEMYNAQDVTNMFSDLAGETRALVDREIQHAYHTNALLVKMLLSQAQAAGASLLVDTNALENEFLLKQMAATEVAALSRPASDFVRRGAGLGKINTVQVPVQDTKASQERDALGAQLSATNEKMQQLQQQSTAMMREKTALNEEVQRLRAEVAAKDQALMSSSSNQQEVITQMQAQFKALSVEAAGAAQVSTTQFDDMKRQLTETRGQLEDARVQLARKKDDLAHRDAELRSVMANAEAHIMNSKQFQQMKAIMQQKSNEVVELRQRLSRYEPQSVPSAGH